MGRNPARPGCVISAAVSGSASVVPVTSSPRFAVSDRDFPVLGVSAALAVTLSGRAVSRPALFGLPLSGSALFASAAFRPAPSGSGLSASGLLGSALFGAALSVFAPSPVAAGFFALSGSAVLGREPPVSAPLTASFSDPAVVAFSARPEPAVEDSDEEDPGCAAAGLLLAALNQSPLPSCSDWTGEPAAFCSGGVGRESAPEDVGGNMLRWNQSSCGFSVPPVPDAAVSDGVFSVRDCSGRGCSEAVLRLAVSDPAEEPGTSPPVAESLAGAASRAETAW
jgi:hypothetical protein